MTPTPLIWITEQIHPDAVEMLRARAEIILPGEDATPHHDRITGIVVRAAPIDADLIARLPALRVVGKHGVGTDNIDQPALSARDIALHTAAGANAESVADLALTLALMLARAPDIASDALKRGTPRPNVDMTGYELSELPCGILGMGVIGRAVARRLAGFGAQVSGYDPMLPDAEWPDSVARRASVDAVLEDTRMLFLHLPLTPDTRHMLDLTRLRQMPQGSFLVNCARGGIVDEAALAQALNEGHLAGAATDVFEREPPAPDLPLLQAPRIIGLTHLGAQTHAALRRTGTLIATKVLTELGV